MVLASKSDQKQLIGTTVIGVPSKDRKRHVTTVLIDNGFTGYAIMTHSFAEDLGYEFQRCKGETYRTAKGHMETSLSVKLTDVRLPHLSRNRTFTATFEIAPAESGDFSNGVIMGIGMMDELGIDQSRTDKIITWGPDVQVPMVPIIIGPTHAYKLYAKAQKETKLFWKSKKTNRRIRRTTILPQKAAATSFWPLTNQQKQVPKRKSTISPISSRSQSATEPNSIHNNRRSCSTFS
jgi:predicted aspartyl protease